MNSALKLFFFIIREGEDVDACDYEETNKVFLWQTFQALFGMEHGNSFEHLD